MPARVLPWLTSDVVRALKQRDEAYLVMVKNRVKLAFEAAQQRSRFLKKGAHVTPDLGKIRGFLAKHRGHAKTVGHYATAFESCQRFQLSI